MKSVIKVSSKVIAIKGSARLTDFRIESLKEKFQSSTSINLIELNCNEIYFACLNDASKIQEHDSLDELCNILSVEESCDFLEEDPTKDSFVKNNIKIESAEDRVRIIKRSCFNGRRIVIFSGGEAKNDDELLKEIQSIKDGGGNGSIVGRNCFQRPKDKALELIDKMISIYKD